MTESVRSAESESWSEEPFNSTHQNTTRLITPRGCCKDNYLSSLPPILQWREGIRIFGKSPEPPIILIDMDNTLVDWESQFHRLMKLHHPDIAILPESERTQFKIELNYQDEDRPAILELTSKNEFWLSMDPVPGAIEAINEMVQLGLVVQLVTTPDEKFTARSAYEKILWVEKHLGVAWKYRLVLTHDKTLIIGDILIDDRPAASVGTLKPAWTHLLFKQPYNRELSCPILQCWTDWGPNVYTILIQRESSTMTLSSTTFPISNSVRYQLCNRPKISPAQLFTASPSSANAQRNLSADKKQCCITTAHLCPLRQSMTYDTL